MSSCSPTINDTINNETGDDKQRLVRNKAQKKEYDLTPGFPKVNLSTYARHCDAVNSVCSVENLLQRAMAREFATKPEQIIMERVFNSKNVSNEHFIICKVNLYSF